MGKSPYVGGFKKLMNVEDASCSLMMVIPTKEWYDLPSLVLVFFHISSQAVFKVGANTD